MCPFFPVLTAQDQAHLKDERISLNNFYKGRSVFERFFRSLSGPDFVFQHGQFSILHIAIAVFSHAYPRHSSLALQHRIEYIICYNTRYNSVPLSGVFRIIRIQNHVSSCSICPPSSITSAFPVYIHAWTSYRSYTIILHAYYVDWLTFQHAACV